MEEKRDSYGEEIIKEFFEEKDIKFEREPKLLNLQYDQNYTHRKPDFYLPRYRVYVEFLGKWNEEECRLRYQEKMAVYRKNKIPCVYIYPDNLGILSWIFKRKLKKELKKYPNLKWQLIRYNWEIFIEENGFRILVLGLLIYFIDNFIVRMILAFFLIWTLYESIRDTFFNNTSYKRDYMYFR